MLEVDLQTMWVYGDMIGSEQEKSERKTQWKVRVKRGNTQRGRGGSEEAHAHVFVY